MVMMIAVAPRLTGRFGPKAMTVTGLVVPALGLGWLAQADAGGSFWVDVLPASLVTAIGTGLAFIPSLGTAISSARPIALVGAALTAATLNRERAAEPVA